MSEQQKKKAVNPDHFPPKLAYDPQKKIQQEREYAEEQRRKRELALARLNQHHIPERRVYKVPDTKGAVKPLLSQQTMAKRFKEAPETWDKIKKYARDRRYDLIHIDGYEKEDAHKKAWLEASFLFPPKPHERANWPEKQLRDESHRRQREAEKQRQAVVKTISKPDEVELPTIPEMVYESDPSAFGRSYDGPEYDEADAEQFCRDITWAYHRIGTPVSKAKSPSPGAYELALWARENRDTFYKTSLAQAMKTRETLEKIRQDAETQREAMRLKAKEEEVKANLMTREEVEELAASLDLCQEFGIEFDEVNQGICRPIRQISDKDAKDFPEVAEVACGSDIDP